MPGALGSGRALERMGLDALESAGDSERAVRQEKQQIKVADETQKASLAGTGAALGATLGAAGSVGGPIGAGIGLAAGYLIGEFL